MLCAAVHTVYCAGSVMSARQAMTDVETSSLQFCVVMVSEAKNASYIFSESIHHRNLGFSVVIVFFVNFLYTKFTGLVMSPVNVL